jgi:hypothetical protein
VNQAVTIRGANVAGFNFSASWSLIQTAESTGSKTISVAASGTGNLIVVAMEIGSSATVSSITDNATGGSNTYVQVPGARASYSAGASDIWYAKNSKVGATTITVTLSSGTPGALVAWQVAGISTTAPLDVAAAANNQPASATPQGPAVTTTNAGDFVVSLAVVTNSITGMAAGNEFTNDKLTAATDGPISPAPPRLPEATGRNGTNPHPELTAAVPPRLRRAHKREYQEVAERWP